jgi:hypothetical protein
MAFTLNREMTQGPGEDHMWRFHVMRTREGSDVQEMFDQPLPHESVARIFREVIGEVPATGLELKNVLENWDRLEPRLLTAIERRIPA